MFGALHPAPENVVNGVNESISVIMDSLEMMRVGLDYNMLSAELVVVCPPTLSTTAYGFRYQIYINVIAKSSQIIKYFEGPLQIPQITASRAVLDRVLDVVDRMRSLVIVDDPAYSSE